MTQQFFSILTTISLLHVSACGSTGTSLMETQEIQNRSFAPEGATGTEGDEAASPESGYAPLEEADVNDDKRTSPEDKPAALDKEGAGDATEPLPPPVPEEVTDSDTAGQVPADITLVPPAQEESNPVGAVGDDSTSATIDDASIYFDLNTKGEDASGKFALVEAPRNEHIKGLGFFFYKKKTFFEFADATPVDFLAGTTISLKARVFEHSKKEVVAIRLLLSGDYPSNKGKEKPAEKDGREARLELIVGIENGHPYYKLKQNDHVIAEANLQTKLIPNEQNHILLSINEGIVGLTLRKETVSSSIKVQGFQVEKANLVIGAADNTGKHQYKGFIESVALSSWTQE